MKIGCSGVVSAGGAGSVPALTLGLWVRLRVQGRRQDRRPHGGGLERGDLDQVQLDFAKQSHSRNRTLWRGVLEGAVTP